MTMGEANELTFQVEHMPYPQIYNQEKMGGLNKALFLTKKGFMKSAPKVILSRQRICAQKHFDLVQ